ncbi:hypothetical protein O3V59_22725, partial [Brevibacillus thermoruber]
VGWVVFLFFHAEETDTTDLNHRTSKANENSWGSKTETTQKNHRKETDQKPGETDCDSYLARQLRQTHLDGSCAEDPDGVYRGAERKMGYCLLQHRF